MDLIVVANGKTGGCEARWGDRLMRAAMGPAGPASAKREGDGTSPVGRFPLRYLMYRPDRLRPVPTGLAQRPLAPADGWCDDPADVLYNRPVRLPYPARHERLWRDDEVYDLIVVLGHNDDPVVPGAGSAVFLHVARADFSPTSGCIVLSREDLLAVLASAGPGDCLVVGPSA
ncbi:MAG TPA: L,D-transpeptidase family protein [Dongiaceae bacterium]|jgi:L,D-peptidoglycan transpeptidase YkuD (ErfK/YbiS/YcfS/YnhG family)|nr:L,D-transpeptidase family protein [Dongiaceae bacterium]